MSKQRLLHFTRYCSNSIKVWWAKLGIYVAFLRDVACRKLLKSVSVSRSYSKNSTGTVFLRHGVCTCVFFRVQVVCQDYQASRYKTQYMSFLRIYTICIRPSINKTRMRGKAQPDGRPALQIIETPFLYFSPLLDQSTRATPLFD